MNPAILLYLAPACCACLAVAAVVRKHRSVASGAFAAGMLALGAESVFSGFSLAAVTANDALAWQRWAFISEALVPGFWLAFSLSYSRGNHREFLHRWRFALAMAFLFPLTLVLGFEAPLRQVSSPTGDGEWLQVSGTGRILAAVRLLTAVLVLTNLEKTFRLTVGTMRWRIKFVLLGVGVIFGSRIYTGSQELLFSIYDQNLATFEAGALLLGCFLMAIAYLRTGFAEADVYPSRTVLEGSITLLVVGCYLLIVGVLAQIVAAMGGVRHFRAQAFLMLLGIVGLATILLSDRFRQGLQRFITRHFRRPQHDFEKVWTELTERLSNTPDEYRVASSAARLISGTFNALAVRIWLVDAERDELALIGSTSDEEANVEREQRPTVGVAELRSISRPTNLDDLCFPGTNDLKDANPRHFAHGGHRVAVPLISGGQWLGLAVLADRVSGVPYTMEEFELLRCIGDQVAASLLNLHLTGEIMRAKELEAFQTVSAFFVHDLKNAASTLNLTLQNLPTHFDDPEFRTDALRGIANTVDRINTVTSRLSSLRGPIEIRAVELDLNELMTEAAKALEEDPSLVVIKNLNPVSKIHADREQMRSVLTNLLLNARDAVSGGGEIRLETTECNGRVILSVADSGCGMTADFLRTSLFRPFRTTKTRGIGIGMFQTKVIVEAHGGTIQVTSAPEQGSTFRVTLPIDRTEP
jgi:putative PEP-CTERM system histidine kinase